ncbi:MAG: branched-chain amino acid ABC transporter permease [Anaerosomatales bacterium]|nr:branched-chain amino acid ABC transporter permease [Anaerosomatales bacterium]
MSSKKSIREALLDHSTLLVLMGVVTIAGVAVQVVGTPLLKNIYTSFCISLMMVLGLQMFMGNSGILSWTHIGFVGVGAYVSGILSMQPMMKQLGVPNMYPFLVSLHAPVGVAILAGGLVAALLAALISYPLMRLSDAAGVITLFATLIVFHVVMTQWDNVTNGPRTFFGLQEYTTLWVALIAALATMVLAWFFRDSALGLRIRASRDDRYAARAIGIDVVQVRYLTFVLSALVMGLAGGIWAHFITSFSPKAFYMAEMFTLISMLVIGGAGSISGAVTGAVVVTIVRESLRQVEAGINNAHVLPFEVFGLTELVLAVFMVLVLIWRPSGVIGAQEIRLPWRTGRNTGGKPAEASEEV